MDDYNEWIHVSCGEEEDRYIPKRTWRTWRTFYSAGLRPAAGNISPSQVPLPNGEHVFSKVPLPISSPDLLPSLLTSLPPAAGAHPILTDWIFVLLMTSLDIPGNILTTSWTTKRNIFTRSGEPLPQAGAMSGDWEKDMYRSPSGLRPFPSDFLPTFVHILPISIQLVSSIWMTTTNGYMSFVEKKRIDTSKKDMEELFVPPACARRLGTCLLPDFLPSLLPDLLTSPPPAAGAHPILTDWIFVLLMTSLDIPGNILTTSWTK